MTLEPDAEEVIARHVDAAAGKMARWILGLIISLAVAATGAVFWAGSMHELVTQIREDLSWLVREKIPSMDAERETLRLKVEPGVLPKADARLDKLEGEHRQMREDIIRLKRP